MSPNTSPMMDWTAASLASASGGGEIWRGGVGKYGEHEDMGGSYWRGDGHEDVENYWERGKGCWGRGWARSGAAKARYEAGEGVSSEEERLQHTHAGHMLTLILICSALLLVSGDAWIGSAGLDTLRCRMDLLCRCCVGVASWGDNT